MRCSVCDCHESKVIESRLTESGNAIRRRRECLGCGRRFTTYERVQEMPLIVIKKDGTRQQFDRAKVQAGMIKACEKRPIPLERIAQAVGEIEASLRNEEPSSEVTSARVGEKVMEKLRELDDVAYIRFASVYKEFDDAKKFAEVVAMLSGEDREANHNTKRSSKRSSAEKRTSLVAPARRKEKLRKPITSQQDKH